MLWLIYNILFTVGYLLMLPKFLLRMWKRGGYRKGFSQRFGIYSNEIIGKAANKKRIWIHAVSVGEVLVALHFIDKMKSVFPDTGYILTTTTSTGHALAEKKLSEDDLLLYFPADFPFIVRRVIRQLKPVALILTECEIWPNLVRTFAKHKIPIAIINGRMSESSYKGYRFLKVFFKSAASCLDLFLVQAQVDYDRLVSLGVTKSKIHVMGSAKYDVAQPDPGNAAKGLEILKQSGMSDGRRILVGGSTWPGEEGILLDIYKKCRQTDENVRLVLVPRHAERRAEVETEILARGLGYIKRSELLESGETPAEEPDVFLMDTTGELIFFYASADLIFVGKSLGDNHGGQNIIEPATCGKPILCGPNMENFPGVIADFKAADAIIQVADKAELETIIKNLLSEPGKAVAYGERAEALVASNRGVVKRSIDLIKEMI